MTGEKDLIICECGSSEHQMIFLYGEDEFDGITYPICYAHVHLNKLPFWRRVKYAISYIMGQQSRYGAFDEFIFNPDDVGKLQKLVDYLNKQNKGGE